jgi:hypothetical protein
MIEEGASLNVECATLPVASFSKFEPQSPEYLDITNPKAMLENGPGTTYRVQLIASQLIAVQLIASQLIAVANLSRANLSPSNYFIKKGYTY